MKYPVITLLVLLISLSSSAQIERKPVVVKADSAQTTNTDNKGDKMSRKERFRELDLTREQKTRIKEINQSSKAEREAIQNNTQLTSEEKEKQLRKLKYDQAQKIQNMLTPEQRAKFKASREKNS